MTLPRAFPALGLVIEAECDALTRILFEKTFVAIDEGLLHPVIAEARRQLNEYLEGRRRDFDLTSSPRGTDFQLAVWEELRRIPYGSTITYGEVALRLGRPDAARAVGGAVGANPLPIVIPCHRVVAAVGLGGYSDQSPGCLELKRRLLALEAAAR